MTPFDLAISAAFSGGIRLAVSLPSVSTMSTFSGMVVFSNILMASPTASPSDVLGPAMPGMASAISVSTSP
ncbi:hypothetical protein D3C86_2185200 [compost metagenome]